MILTSVLAAQIWEGTSPNVVLIHLNFTEQVLASRWRPSLFFSATKFNLASLHCLATAQQVHHHRRNYLLADMMSSGYCFAKGQLLRKPAVFELIPCRHQSSQRSCSWCYPSPQLLFCRRRNCIMYFTLEHCVRCDSSTVWRQYRV